MRITTWMTQQKRLAELQSSQARLDTAQDQVSSGLKIKKLSDDPAGAVALLRVSARLSQRQQEGASIQAALPYLKTAEAALGDISTALLSARTAAQRAANTATTSSSDRAALAAQIEAAAQTVLSRANAKAGDAYVFAGTATATAPFVAGETVTYAGNSAALKIDLAQGQPFDMSITGEQLRGSPGGDLFASLKQLAQDVRSGEASAIQAGLERIGSEATRVVQLRGDMGARINYVTMAQERIDQDIRDLEARQAALSEVDLAEAIVLEKRAENGQQATLAMASRLGGASLLDYLR